MRRLPPALTASVLLLVVACGGSTANPGTSSAATPSAAASAAASAAGQTVTIHETDFKLTPSEVAVKAGAVTFQLTDEGQAPHDLHIAPKGTTNEVAASQRMTAGGSTALTVTLQPGTYDMWCGVPGHRALGMQGTITVT